MYDMLIISWCNFLGLLYYENRLKCQFLPSHPAFYFKLVVADWKTNKKTLMVAKLESAPWTGLTLIFLLDFHPGPSASTEAVKAKSNIKMEFLGYHIFVGPF